MGLFWKSKNEQARELTQKGLDILDIQRLKKIDNLDIQELTQKKLDNLDIDPRCLYSITFFIKESSQYEGAIKFFDNALKLDPNNPTTLFYKGMMLEHHEPEEAIQYFLKAVKICPAGIMWYEIGRIQLLRQRNIEEARKSFDKAFELDPNNIELIKLISNSVNFRGELFDYANTFLSNYLSRNQKDAEAWYLKGETLTSIENYDNAYDCYLRAVEINPEKYSFLDEKIKKIRWLKDSNQHSVVLAPSEKIIGKFFCDIDNAHTRTYALFHRHGADPTPIDASDCCLLTNFNLYLKKHNKLKILPLEKISSIENIGNLTLSIKYGPHKTDEHIMAFRSKAFSQFNSSLAQAMATKRDKIERNVKGNTIIDFSSIKEYLKNGGVVMQTFKCPGCGAALEFPDNVDTTTCQFCGNNVKAVDLFEKIRTLI